MNKESDSEFQRGYITGLINAYETMSDESSNVNVVRSCLRSCDENGKCIQKCMTDYISKTKSNPDSTLNHAKIEEVAKLSNEEQHERLVQHMFKYVMGRQERKSFYPLEIKLPKGYYL